VNTVVKYLGRLIQGPEAARAADSRLLEAFVVRKDQQAFEALVRRHGPMVLGVCRRILGNHHDAEDAFQATFLVLARKASSVRPRRLVSNWLYGVACNTARKARAMITRRRWREKQVTNIPEPQAGPPDPWLDLQPVLDQELALLPDKYRIPIVLCDLEGLSIKEATEQLSWPQGTVAGRLARGRSLLARRLAGRGLVVPASLVAGAWAAYAASAAVPHGLIRSTVGFAGAVASGQGLLATAVPAKVIALTEGVIKTMFLTKLKTLGMVLAAFVFLLGAGAWACQVLMAENGLGPRKDEAIAPVQVSQRPATAPRQALFADKESKKPKTDPEQLQGKWRLAKAEQYGMTWVVKDGELVCLDRTPKAFPIDFEVPFWVRFSGDRMIEEYPQGDDSTLVERWTFRLDVSKKPKWITISRKGKKDVDGIYSFEQGRLRICWNIVYGKNRAGHPAGFDTKENLKKGMDTEVWVLERPEK
jgi:RNA polymerase sigma factor (sigma-70 family)